MISGIPRNNVYINTISLCRASVLGFERRSDFFFLFRDKQKWYKIWTRVFSRFLVLDVIIISRVALELLLLDEYFNHSLDH